MADERKLPKGRMSRLIRLAELGARTGAGVLLSERSKVSAAERAAEVLGTMRGLAAKVGQMASYVDGFIPEDHRPAFESALSSLRTATPTSSPVAIRALLEVELGAKLSELFAEFSETPFASASIGQVHRATLFDGSVVAVKVQHPGIEHAIESDLQNAGMIERMVSVLGPSTLNSKAVFEEVRARFLEELDYTLEAKHQLAFAQLHAGDSRIRIPRVFLERSSRRVLTTELASGKSLDEAFHEPEHVRGQHCETLWRFVFKGNLLQGMFNADPHPGNYLFAADGRITFLDFGCVQLIPEQRRIAALAMHRAAVARDEERFFAAARQVLDTRGGAYEEQAFAYSRKCFEPLFNSPFRMTRRYVRGLVEDVKQMKQLIWQKDSNFVPLPPGLVFLNRLQFGFYSVLARLDAEVDYARVETEFLNEAPGTGQIPKQP